MFISISFRKLLFELNKFNKFSRQKCHKSILDHGKLLKYVKKN